MNSDREIQLAKSLKRLMKQRNLTLTTVSRRTGMNKSTLHNYCNGVIPRNLLKLKELADLLGVTLTELVFDESPCDPPQTAFPPRIDGRFEITIRRIEE